MLIAILVDLAVMHIKLDAIGLKSGVERVVEERRTFLKTFDSSFLLLDPRTGANMLQAHLRQLSSRSQELSAHSRPILNQMLDQLKKHLNQLLPTVEVFCLRLLSLVATLPIIAICCMVAAVDGWVRREVRKAGAGIESARIYHFAKRSINPVFIWVSLMYLTLPMSIDVRWVYGTLAVTIPLLLGVTISRFKKYV